MAYNLQSIKTRSIISIFASGLRAFFGFVTMLTLANAFGDQQYGKYIILSSMSAALIYFLDLHVSKIYFVRASIQSDMSVHSAVALWLVMQTLILFGLILFFPSFLEVIYQIEASYIFYAVLTSSFLQNRLFSLLSHLCEVRRRTHVTQVVATFTTLALFILVQISVTFLEFNLTVFFLLSTGCWFVASLAMYFALRLSLKQIFNYSHGLEVLKNLGYLIYRGRFLVSISLIGICGEYADRWLLTKFSSWEAVGSYGLSKQFSGIILIFSSALFPIMIREISEKFSEGQTEVAHSIFVKFTDFLLLTTASLVSYFLIWRTEIIETLIHAPFRDLDYLLTFTIIAIFHQVLGQSYGTFLIAAQSEKIEARLSPYFVSLGLISTFIVLSPSFFGLGGVHLVFKQLIVQIFCVTMLGFFIAREIGISYSLFRQLLIIFPVISVTYLVGQLLKVLFTDGMLAMFLAVVFQGLLFLMLLIFFNQRIWKNV